MQGQMQVTTDRLKPYKFSQQLMKNLIGQNTLKRAYKPDNIVQEPKEASEHKIVEFVWEGDIEDRIKFMFSRNVTVEDCKAMISNGLGIPSKNVTLVNRGKKLNPTDEIHTDDEIAVEFTLDDWEVQPSQAQVEIAPSESVMPVVVQKVMMHELDGHKRYIEVGVVKCKGPLEYLGGYINRLTNKVYYHARVQTLHKGCLEQKLQTPPRIKTYDRETQTLLPLIDEGVNTSKDKCTQMSGNGVYIPALTDKIISAKPYHEYKKVLKKMTPMAAVTLLQRAWRQYITKKKVLQKYKSLYEAKQAQNKFKGSSLVELNKQQIVLLTRASFPTSRSDFYDLYTALGEHLVREKKAVAIRKYGYAYKVAMAEVRSNQRKALLGIEKHRIQAKEENLQKQDIMFLEGTARSRVRLNPKGNKTFIDDLNIKRARDIKEIYSSYTRTDVTETERIEILTSIKNWLAGFEVVDLTSDLIELLEREIDLITIGIDQKQMEYLKKRFESLFIDLAKKPEFNPQAKYYKKSTETERKYPMHRCANCNKVCYPSHMFMHLRMSKFKICTSCSYMHTTATASINLAPYKRLLNWLRTAETQKGCRGALAFLLQPMGMYFLVNVLWGGKCIKSGSSYLPGLRVTRWMPHEEWSMWNMILLTELEAHRHEKLEDPLDFYDKDFVLNVTNRNILGRIHFNMVADIDEKFRKREPGGVLPKDHLLRTTKKAAAHLPINNPHSFLVPNTKSG